MDKSKKSDFVRASRQKFAKGGRVKAPVKRKYFADGGDTTLGGPGGGSGVDATSANPNAGFMGSVNNFLGLNDNYKAGSANIQYGTNAAQLNNAYTDVQNALGQQQGLTNKLGTQVSPAIHNQQMLAQQYSDMAQGKGPNPAQAQLAQATAANVGNQNALMAGQRGAQGNVGLMARQAAQQGASTQQQSAGQAATLGAQQQIAAQQNLAGLSNNQISQAGQAVTGINSAQQNEQAMLQNANTSTNNANVGMQSNINNVNSQTAAANQNMGANTMGGMMSATSASNLSDLFAKGGQVGDHHLKIAQMNAAAYKHLADGGDVDSDSPNLGTFKASDDSASTPNVSSTAALPGDSTSFASAMQGGKSSGGGGGGGGAISGMMALADGGPIQPGQPVMPIGANQLLGPQGGAMASLGSAHYNTTSASGGPSIAGTAALPHNTESFSKDVKDMLEKDDDTKKEDTTGKDGTATDWETGGGLAGGASDTMSNSPTDMATPDSNLEYAAKGGPIKGPHKSHVANFLAQGGKVPAMVSAGEVYLSPDQVNKVVNEDVDPAEIGHKFKGKAKVKGDSYSNDTIPATLEEGGVVVDRDHMGSADKRKLFVHKTVAKKRAGG